MIVGYKLRIINSEVVMSKMILYHGSDHIVKAPKLSAGKKENDYGQGFYCTEDIELAKEWACKFNKDGFVNVYEIDMTDLDVLNLNDSDKTILNWIAILINNRTITTNTTFAKTAMEYLTENFYIDTKAYDIVIGYRADDSYFNFAESFVANGLPINSLSKALKVGKLGEQIALVSEKAFEKIKFVEAIPVDKNIYYPKFETRDKKARKQYKDELSNKALELDDLFVMDIIRQGMKNDDPRLR